MSNISNSVLLQAPDKSTHNLTEELRTSTHVGRITPVYIAEVVPGDSVDLNAEFLTKFAPMDTPAMQNFNAYVHYFYVPFRILWRNWKYFIQNIPVPGGAVPPTPPYLKLDTRPQAEFDAPATSFVHNYFGFQGPTNLEAVNALPYAAYQLIFNEYYRHQNITTDDRESLYLNDGDNSAKLPLLQKVNYRTYKDDYFTSALQSPQSGTEASLALLTNNMLPVYANNNPVGTYPAGDTYVNHDNTGGHFSLGSATPVSVFNKIGTTTDPDVPGGFLYVNPAEASFQITMNELIELNRMQEFLVRQNLSGNRYNEYILAFFGVRVPDLRIDRPDYICGIKAPVVISEVLNTGSNQGTQTGQGNSYAEGGQGNYYVHEHGIIMGLYTCMPNISYNNAIARFFFKSNYEDYYAPIFDQMGEREIINKEIVQNHVNPYGTFGYVPKFAEYRLPFNKNTGQFAGNLSAWHLGRALPNNATLNSQFFDCKNPSGVFHFTDPTLDDAILLWIVNKVFMTRPMKKYSMPVLTNDYGNNIS